MSSHVLSQLPHHLRSLAIPYLLYEIDAFVPFVLDDVVQFREITKSNLIIFPIRRRILLGIKAHLFNDEIPNMKV